MATILVVAHALDRFGDRHFLVRSLFDHWTSAGHRVVVREGTDDLPPADVALLHLDCSVVPPEYVEALARYPVVVNGRVTDIRKRAFSEHLVTRASDYGGAVIVKTNLNSGGVPEACHARTAVERGLAPLPPARFMTAKYPVFESPCHVPASAWSDPDVVIEKFLPERDERGYYVRHWVFLGDRERCNRVLGASPVLKSDDVIERVPVPVPDELREARRRLGIDYGKLDFVIHEGKPVLFDVNRTPTFPRTLAAAMNAGMASLAEGIEAFTRGSLAGARQG